MFERFISHRKIYIFFLLLLVFGISTGKFLMSVGTIGISFNWLVEGNYKEKYNRLKNLKWAPIILAGGYIIHLLWLFNTSEFDYAYKDLLKKLPLFALPIVIGTSKVLNKKESRILFFIFLGGVFISTIISTLVYFEVIPPKHDTGNFRDISLFMSHIRFSLLVAFSFILCVFLMLMQKSRLNIYYLFISIWFLFMLFILQSFTGLIAWIIAAGFLFVIALFTHKTRTSALLAISWFVFVGIGFWYVAIIVNDFYTIKDTRVLSELPVFSKNGEPYVHDVTSTTLENGNYVDVCTAQKEIRSEWKTLSQIHIDSNDQKGQKIMSTIYRYLTSKGLNKDSAGLHQLSSKEREAIEQGKTSCINYNIFEKRIRETLFELELYRKGGEINRHSVSQRLVFLKTGFNIIKNNIWLGVGIGDVPNAFKEQYKLRNYGLEKKNQKRSHNQFVTYLITYGIIGFSLWLFTVIYPIFVSKSKQNLLYGAFLFIMLVGFLSDDMHEIQAGITIYITLNSLLLFTFFPFGHSVLVGAKV